MKCPTCNKEIGTFVSDERSMKEKGECFECALWRERLSLVGNPDVAIIDGTLYTIGDEDSKDPFRGFGGDISEAWRPQFPNNADFDWQWKKSPCGISYLVPKENKEEIPDSLIAQAETSIGM